MKPIDGGITAPRGFRAAGVACGLKKDGAPDLALIVSDTPASAAGVFTKNIVQGHSLQLSQRNIRSGRARAVVINSGNANACLGPAGDRDALAMAKPSPVIFGVRSRVLTGSTGVIGKKWICLPSMPALTRLLPTWPAPSKRRAPRQQAIMTTDLVPKSCVVEFELEGILVRVAGMAKGSGMIHPDMATMIGVITTVAPWTQRLCSICSGRRSTEPSIGFRSTVTPVFAIWLWLWPTARRAIRRLSRLRKPPGFWRQWKRSVPSCRA